MKRQMIAFVAASALALSGMSVPAEAKNKDALKLIVGAAAVALLLQQMNKAEARPVTRNPPPDDYYPAPTQGRAIPSECLMDVTVNGRLREVVSSRCLREFGLAGSIPAECSFDIRTSAGKRTVYGPQCLRDYGYRIERARY